MISILVMVWATVLVWKSMRSQDFHQLVPVKRWKKICWLQLSLASIFLIGVVSALRIQLLLPRMAVRFLLIAIRN